MTIDSVPGTDLRYHLISFDRDGIERRDDPDAPGGRASEGLYAELESEPVTDVFVMSHGWQGDVPAAIHQCRAWVGAMARTSADREAIRRLDPDFHPLLVGLHWPSLPWGDESLEAGPVSFGSPGEDPLAPLVAGAAPALADSETAHEALATIFASALDDVAPAEMPPEVADAYRTLWQEAGLAAGGPGAPPGEDGEAFDPEAAYQAVRDEEAVAFAAGGIGGALLAPLRGLSFWKMKQRARAVGESGIAALLREIQRRSGSAVRCHLMGHSFGCIVMSAAVGGAGAVEPLPRPVDTLFLAQGALSLWSYASAVPAAPGKAGYFHPIVRDLKATSIVTTRSVHDTAVGRLYPMAAGLARQVGFAPGELPRYGAVGAFGLRGPGVPLVDLDLLPTGGEYPFAPGKVYNLEASRTICEGGGAAGAHSDIAKPEVAHAFWAAVRAARS